MGLFLFRPTGHFCSRLCIIVTERSWTIASPGCWLAVNRWLVSFFSEKKRRKLSNTQVLCHLPSLDFWTIRSCCWLICHRLFPAAVCFFIFISYMWGRAVGVLIFVWFSVTWLVLILHFLCYAGRGGGLLVRQFLDFAAISLIRWFAQIELFSEVWICISWDLVSSIVILLPDSWGSFDFCLLVL